MFDRCPLIRTALTLLFWAAFGVAFLESVRAVVAWQQGGDMTTVEWIWFAVSSVCLYVYVRYVSIFRHRCDGCELSPPHDDLSPGRRA